MNVGVMVGVEVKVGVNVGVTVGVLDGVGVAIVGLKNRMAVFESAPSTVGTIEMSNVATCPAVNVPTVQVMDVVPVQPGDSEVALRLPGSGLSVIEIPESVVEPGFET